MKTMSSNAHSVESSSAVQLAALTVPAELLHEQQQRMLKSRLTPHQAETLEVYAAQVHQAVAQLDAAAKAAAMKALLEPNDARHRTRAFFSHAKARAMASGLLQFDAVLFHCDGSFSDFIAEVRCSQESCQHSHLLAAAEQTRALIGKDPTSDEYAGTRNDAACAQGEEEAYGDLLELFERVVAGVSRHSC